MSEPKTKSKVARREGVLAVHSLDHFVLVVPDLDEASQFFAEFGLDVRQEDGKLGLYTDGNAHRWALIEPGETKKLARLSFACFQDDFARFENRLTERGVEFERVGTCLEFADPAGMAISIQVAARSAPESPAPFEACGGKVGKRAAPLRSEVSGVRPVRLSHLAMFTRDIDAVIDFYQSILGLRLSDRSLDIVAFMHGAHGSDHHMLALLNSSGPGLHHSSWEVSSINDIGLGAEHMAQAGFAHQWGLGRHVLGSNYFNYVRDPWGSWAEYSAGMDYVPADVDYPGADHGPEDSFYLWGPAVPADLTDNLEQGG